ncbi:MAG: hypothetical protein ACPH6E_03405, partial [Candidatus Puniceispirillaceae bacterium]
TIYFIVGFSSSRLWRRCYGGCLYDIRKKFGVAFTGQTRWRYRSSEACCGKTAPQPSARTDLVAVMPEKKFC